MMCYVCEKPEVNHTHGDIGFCGPECLDKFKMLRMLATYDDKGLTKVEGIEIPEHPDNDNYNMPVVWVAIPEIESDITYLVNDENGRVMLRPQSKRECVIKFWTVKDANEYKDKNLAHIQRWRFELWSLSALPEKKYKRTLASV